MKYIIVLLLTLSANAFAQSYVVTNSKGEVIYSIQQQGNQAQIVNNRGYVTESLTIYPNQIVNTESWAIGKPTMYIIPPSPPSPLSVRVIQ